MTLEVQIDVCLQEIALIQSSAHDSATQQRFFVFFIHFFFLFRLLHIGRQQVYCTQEPKTNTSFKFGTRDTKKSAKKLVQCLTHTWRNILLFIDCVTRLCFQFKFRRLPTAWNHALTYNNNSNLNIRLAFIYL